MDQNDTKIHQSQNDTKINQSQNENNNKINKIKKIQTPIIDNQIKKLGHNPLMPIKDKKNWLKQNNLENAKEILYDYTVKVNASSSESIRSGDFGKIVQEMGQLLTESEIKQVLTASYEFHFYKGNLLLQYLRFFPYHKDVITEIKFYGKFTAQEIEDLVLQKNTKGNILHYSIKNAWGNLDILKDINTLVSDKSKIKTLFLEKFNNNNILNKALEYEKKKLYILDYLEKFLSINEILRVVRDAKITDPEQKKILGEFLKNYLRKFVESHNASFQNQKYNEDFVEKYNRNSIHWYMPQLMYPLIKDSNYGRNFDITWEILKQILNSSETIQNETKKTIENNKKF